MPFLQAACVAALAGSAVAGEPAATGAIGLTPAEGGLNITAHVTGGMRAATGLETSLEIVRADSNGSVRTSQVGTLDVAAGQSMQVAQTTVSFAPVGTLDIEFVIRHSGSVIHRVTHRVVNGVTD